MSVMDTVKGLVDKGRALASDNSDKIQGAVDKAGGFIDHRTGGRFSDTIGKGAKAVKQIIPEQTPSQPSMSDMSRPSGDMPSRDMPSRPSMGDMSSRPSMRDMSSRPAMGEMVDMRDESAPKSD